jgi:fatty-acyl-CoA synthase
VKQKRPREAQNVSDSRITPTPSAYTYPLLIKHLLHTPLAIAPQQEIVYRTNVRFTYRQFRERIGRLASALAAAGVAPGATVAMMDWDSHRYLECYFAVPMMGAVLMTVNIRLSPDQVAYTLNHSKATTVIVHADFLPLLAGIMPKLQGLERVVVIAEGAEVAAPAKAIGEYEALLAAASPDYEFADFDENTRATTFYTTGTTGDPKGVCFSHRQIVLHTIVMMAALANPASGQRFHRGDVYMPMTPMFHVHGWGVPYVATLMGVKQVYVGRYTPDMFCELRQREHATFSHGVPAVLGMLLTEAAKRNVDLNGWKMIIGGSSLTAGLARTARERGIDLFTGYGMSETCPLLTLAQLPPDIAELPTDEDIALRCKTGIPVPLVDLRIVDPEMKDVAHDGKEAGEVVARAPWLTQCYLDNPQASETLWSGGYLHTQDIGTIGANGWLTVTDRIKDVIKSGGEWVSSLELESLISQVAGVSEVAVIAVKDARWGERPLAVVVAKPGGPEVTAEAVRQHLLRQVEACRLSKFAVPDKILLAEALEKTSVGKLDKKRMREKYAVA